MEHIKGKWKVLTEQTGMFYIEEDQGRGFKNPTVCLLYQDVTPTDSVGCIDLEALPNAAANAALIAAAPELLAALEEVNKVMLQVSATMGNPAMAHLLPFGLRERVDELSFKGIGAVIARARGVSA